MIRLLSIQRLVKMKSKCKNYLFIFLDSERSKAFIDFSVKVQVKFLTKFVKIKKICKLFFELENHKKNILFISRIWKFNTR